MMFLDGVCPKCNGDTHGYSLDESMRCSQCGWESEVESEDARTIRECRIKARRNRVQAENKANGVDPLKIKAVRKEQRITGQHMAELCKVSPADYAFWEQEDKPMPEWAYNICLNYLD